MDSTAPAARALEAAPADPGADRVESLARHLAAWLPTVITEGTLVADLDLSALAVVAISCDDAWRAAAAARDEQARARPETPGEYHARVREAAAALAEASLPGTPRFGPGGYPPEVFLDRDRPGDVEHAFAAARKAAGGQGALGSAVHAAYKLLREHQGRGCCTTASLGLG